VKRPSSGPAPRLPRGSAWRRRIQAPPLRQATPRSTPSPGPELRRHRRPTRWRAAVRGSGASPPEGQRVARANALQGASGAETKLSKLAATRPPRRIAGVGQEAVHGTGSAPGTRRLRPTRLTGGRPGQGGEGGLLSGCGPRRRWRRRTISARWPAAPPGQRRARPPRSHCSASLRWWVVTSTRRPARRWPGWSPTAGPAGAGRRRRSARPAPAGRGGGRGRWRTRPAAAGPGAGRDQHVAGLGELALGAPPELP
jgi:hypothetical protein